MFRINRERDLYSPELEKYKSEIGEPTHYGEALTIVGHPFAEPIQNQDLLNLALSLGLDESKVDAVKRAITATGFTTRYFSNLPGREVDIPRALERVTEIGSILLAKTLKAKGWEDGFDLFLDTSAFLPTTINKAILHKMGISENSVTSRSYRYACAGAVGAFIDCLSDPSLHDARIVIGALEPLSLLLDKNQFLSPETITFPSIFGDANTFMAFEPSKFVLDTKKIVVQPDGGVIQLKSMYDFDEFSSSRVPIPNYYEFPNHGDEIFNFSSEGAFLKIPTPDNGSAVYMDGMATGFFFGDKTTKVITELVDEWGNKNLLNQLKGKNIIMHPASKPVVDRIAKLLYRNPNRYLDKPELPFLMDKAGYSNGSSATTLNRWRYMIENKLLDQHQPMLWIAPGIGSAIAGAIGWINP
ncbi:hypothetical protein COT86_01320 [Candidatus Collierbacteria bacterium CG10_big_fil_rev_8_21_14_0_10_43_36]|uniref:Beta-ketoacyl-[acyl-carrier-protein] synthase III C-terminal domain-containing protein n=3 Tax=Candidatus Collieribacteriota TaxID=1752725 RepID=A0A2H0DV82_9BACT|nr:hypothetical protein [bacterium]PIP86075.1 MAG: hypothetical protein COW83_00885 [Candidatus Collierbacteria bacterium CG22_combo_CG10-13_8_21_14_all_43_12]PIR99939.1 MAG: hypothetical protein COT86_01320 [Candidatus Collierbacteria bacterium CG10_big_fil_rev_8_21_14_0_10_43_36]PIZ24625.1 MAG: hypothetical protein COY48_01975 [Candidatus Collierbacteria bacterium CG_4_10_14_0_8_um_filter_43_86]PJB47029.1 MAG: hypothetical protein CO104_04745 [Candidatus Collierbacteria bacterium CG_4_9_14_3_